VHDHEAQLYAFDVLALDGDELRVLPLYLRKTRQIYSASSLIGRTESP
jgi:ATP-dependent DNA ligase